MNICLSGRRVSSFSPGRGLRQGDPLSPYLFILVAEVLSSMMTKCTNSQHLKGIKLSNQGPTISHTFFADDALFFMNANQENCRRLAQLLDMYYSASGQLANLSKSGLIFSQNTPALVRDQVSQALNIPVSEDPGKYLGIPSVWGKTKQQALAYVKEKVGKKVQGWRRKLLSPAGREVMVKAVINAIPIYPMTCFKFPNKSCLELDRLISDFWWGETTYGGNVHWKSWQYMKQPKCEGGMGFKDFAVLNDALLAKSAWKLTQEEDTLWARVLKGIYFPNSTFMTAQKGHKASWIWSSLLTGRDLLKEQCMWLIGNGKSINVWLYQWIPGLPGNSLKTHLNIDSVSDMKVNSLLKDGYWDSALLTDIFPTEVVSLIQDIQISHPTHEDRLIWTFAKNGRYSVKLGYKSQMMMQKSATAQPSASWTIPKEIWKKIWKIRTIPRVNQFLWRCCNGVVATKNALFRRHSLVNPLCPICLAEPETLEHLFFFCPWVRCVWFGSTISLRVEKENINSFVVWFNQLMCAMAEVKEEGIILVVWILWFIWKERNAVVFQHKDPSPQSVISQVSRAVAENFQSCSDQKPNCSGSPNNQCEKWQPPPIDWVKVNCDGSFLQANRPAAIGLVCRDQASSFMWGFGELCHADSAFVTEVLAVRKAIIISQELNIPKVIIESDCLSLVRCLASRDISYGDWRGLHYLEETLALAESRSDLVFSFINREGNGAADCLAVDCRKEVYPTGWVATPSLLLTYFLSRDKAGAEVSSSTSEATTREQDPEGIG